MASCQSVDGNNADFLFTITGTGDTFALCSECGVGWMAAMLQTMTGVDPAPFIAAISDDGEQITFGGDSGAESDTEVPDDANSIGELSVKPSVIERDDDDSDHDGGPLDHTPSDDLEGAATPEES